MRRPHFWAAVGFCLLCVLFFIYAATHSPR
jgi:hypothetical protein